MKKALFFITCMVIMAGAYCQEDTVNTPGSPVTKQEYLQKSRNQKTGAIVLISAGGVVTFIGMIVGLDNSLEDIFEPNKPSGGDETLAGVLIVGGVAAMLGSIILFKSARKNKERALSMSFKNELVPHLQRGIVFNRSIPSFNIKIRF